MFGRRASEHEAVYAKLVPQLEPLEAIAAKSLASSLSLSPHSSLICFLGYAERQWRHQERRQQQQQQLRRRDETKWSSRSTGRTVAALAEKHRTSA